MLSFVNDYSEGAHEKILQKLWEINKTKMPGYGTDSYSSCAKQKIRDACNCPEAEVYFLTGGTQTNQIVINSLTAQYQGVVSVDCGHIATHEAGAIEFTGHKILTVPSHEGKMASKDLIELLTSFYSDPNHEHMVFPGMVYISHPTEYGTLYTLEELKELYEICAGYHIPLYLDGARLGYALACPQSDLTLQDIAKYTDVFYIGGTKCGALFGEAVVFTKNNAPKHFSTRIKQHGALLAKGWLLGLQFDTLFTDGLYLEISRNAIESANQLKDAFQTKGYQFFLDSPTNQIFIVLENSQMERLRESVQFSFWGKLDDTHTVVRFATSWATDQADVQALIALL